MSHNADNPDSLEPSLRADIEPAGGTSRPERWQRLADEAAEPGQLTVAYSWQDSPIGRLLVAATETGVVRLAFDTEDTDATLQELADRLSPRVLEDPPRLEAARRQLDQYFDGRRTTFELPLDWRLTRGFRQEVLAVTARIPFGATETYSTVARAAGNARAVRAAGSALASNPIPVLVPCHRVLRTDGSLGGYRGGLARKTQLLVHEAEGGSA